MESQSIAPNGVKSTTRHDYSILVAPDPKAIIQGHGASWLHYTQLHDVHNITKHLNDGFFQIKEVVINKALISYNCLSKIVRSALMENPKFKGELCLLNTWSHRMQPISSIMLCS